MVHALTCVFSFAQCGLHEWTEEQTKAWNWLWGKISLAFDRTLEPLESEQILLVRESWEQVLCPRISNMIIMRVVHIFTLSGPT
jgi:hypothetical protein